LRQYVSKKTCPFGSRIATFALVDPAEGVVLAHRHGADPRFGDQTRARQRQVRALELRLAHEARAEAVLAVHHLVALLALVLPQDRGAVRMPGGRALEALADVAHHARRIACEAFPTRAE
jgi:hypothetical protein